jgi:NitT/TauT family transport system ATP-binding protein
MTTLLTCESVSKSFFDVERGQEVKALNEVSLEIPDRQFLTLIGPSGCGKTTLLNIFAGFERATSGRVLLDGRPISEPGPERGVVFQDYALFPWQTLRQNVEYGPRQRGLPRDEVRRRADEFIAMVGLNGYEERYPHELSGGMRQRVSLARVLANDPKVLLMDEPFAALDAQTRALLQVELARIWAETDKTVLFVTHSVEEAVLLGDRAVVMSARPGVLKADILVDLPRPRDPTSAEFNAYRREIEALVRPEIARVAAAAL